MAQTSLLLNFEIGSNGTPTTLVTTLSDKATSADFSRSQDLPEANVFNQGGAKSFVAGLTEGEFGMEFMWDTTLDAHLNGLIGYTTAVSFQYGPDGSASGKPKYTGSLFLTNLSNPATVGDVKVVSATFKPTGAITRSTFA
jgi:hypothetical protein